MRVDRLPRLESFRLSSAYISSMSSTLASTHHGPPDLECRRELAGGDGQLVGQDPVLADPFHPRAAGVHLGHESVDLLPEIGVGGQLLVVRHLAPLVRPLRQRLGVERQQRRQVAPALADDDGLGDERVALQLHLDVLGRDVLPGGGDDEVLLPAREPEIAVGVERSQVTRVHPTLGVEQLGRCSSGR